MHVNVSTVLTNKSATAVTTLTCIMRFPYRISHGTPTFLRLFTLFSCIAGQFEDGRPSIAFYIGTLKITIQHHQKIRR